MPDSADWVMVKTLKFSQFRLMLIACARGPRRLRGSLTHERGRALIQGAQGAKGSGIRRRAPGADSLSVLRVRSSMRFGRFRHSQPAPTYKVPQDGPPNEYSLMLILRGPMAPGADIQPGQNNGRNATPANFLIKTINYHP